MRSIYLTNHCYASLPLRASRAPRERFIRYYNDLFDLEGIKRPEPEAYLHEGQYSYAELGDAVLTSCQRDNLFNELDLFVVAYWGHEFDPEGSFGAYFSKKYHIHTRMFDICDQGILAPITAIHVIQSFINAGIVNKAALLCFDQTSIPVEKNFSRVFPNRSSARVMIFESEKTSNALCQIETASIFENEAANNMLPASNSDNFLITSDSEYYSCAELFSPIFDEAKNFHDPKNITLQIQDSESQKIGILSVTKNFY